MQLETLFQELLRAPVTDATPANCLAGNLYSGVSCSAVARDASLQRRRVPVAVAVTAAVPAHAGSAAAVEPDLAGAKPSKAKAASAPAKASSKGGTLQPCMLKKKSTL